MKKLLTFIVFAFFASLSFAQTPAAKPPVKVANALASGTAEGTYWKMTNQYLAQCNNESFFNNKVQDGGSPATVSDILANEALGGIVQFDVLWLRNKATPSVKESIKVLLPLHNEQVHFVALSKNPKIGGFMGFNQDSVNLKDVAALKGFVVAAGGGSSYTAEVINGLGKVGYKLATHYKSPQESLNAVEKGEAVAAVFVGGAPIPSIQNLDSNKFRLLPFDQKTINEVKDVYAPANIQYDNFGTTGFPTVEVNAYLVVNDFKSKAMSARLLALRDCIKENIHDIAEAPKAHAAWRQVVKNLEKNEQLRWPSYVGRP